MTTSDKKIAKFLSLVPVENFESVYSKEVSEKSYFGSPIDPLIEAEQHLLDKKIKSIGYFSMEYGLSTNTYNAFSSSKPASKINMATDHHVFSNLRAMDYYLSLDVNYLMDLPIYSGGLGILAGDTLKSAADRAVPLVGVGILWSKGYFKQNFWFKDGQVPEENNWDPANYPGLVPLDIRVEVRLKKDTIRLKLWKYFIYSFDKKSVIPLILLDSNIPENSLLGKILTSQLYRSDNADWKILQRIILGIGGMKALQKLGYSLDVYHLNEGHAAFAFIEKAKGLNPDEIENLKKHFAYTCHTPVAAGHDRFQKKALHEFLSDEEMHLLSRYGQDSSFSDVINLTELAMNTSGHVNAVAQKHGEVTRLQFPHHRDKIQAITNGVHSHTWVSESFAKLFDRYPETADWKKHPESLKNVLNLKNNTPFRKDLWEAHQENKKKLCLLLRSWQMDPDVFTICWARRIASYKRPSLILQDVNRLLQIAENVGPIQIILAGKAHPADDLGFTFVNDMLSTIDSLEKDIRIVRVAMLENYDSYFGKLLSNSVDVWLNNPLPPFEASGTSGMKAIFNGVLQLSTLDGWVVEAADKNIGWIFGWQHHGNDIGDERNLRIQEDGFALYQMLEKIVKLYYQTNQKEKIDPTSDWIDKMIGAVASSAFFNTDRMVGEYSKKIWEL